jgi:DNA-binding GntR family transcriptional regulator
MVSRRAKRRSATSPSVVYDRLKQMILDQQIAPGDPLPEMELARTFRVSRTPVHEALVRLEKDRLSGSIS